MNTFAQFLPTTEHGLTMPVDPLHFETGLDELDGLSLSSSFGFGSVFGDHPLCHYTSINAATTVPSLLFAGSTFGLDAHDISNSWDDGALIDIDEFATGSSTALDDDLEMELVSVYGRKYQHMVSSDAMSVDNESLEYEMSPACSMASSPSSSMPVTPMDRIAELPPTHVSALKGDLGFMSGIQTGEHYGSYHDQARLNNFAGIAPAVGLVY